MLLFPISVLASDVDYEMTHYHIVGDVTSSGDLNICEYIGQDGSFNGYEREIDYKSLGGNFAPSSLSNIRVYDYDSDTLKLGREYKLDNNATNGDNVVIRMYNKANYEEVGYALCYTFNDMVLVHSDVAELYFNAIPSGMEDVLEDVKVVINLPSVDNDLRVFVHGPLYGNVSRKKSDVSYIEATIDELDSYTNLEVRMLFNKDLVKDAKKTDQNEVFDSVLEEEEEYATIANRQRDKAKLYDTVQIGIFVFNVLVIIVLVIRAYFKYDKEHKISFDMEYYREIPNDYGPVVLEYLLKKNVTNVGYSSCILDLIDKKVITVEKIADKKNDYILRKSKNIFVVLNDYEEEILNFLFTEVGNGEMFTLSSLKDYSSKEKTARKFLTHYQKWQAKSIKDSLKYDFYEGNNKPVGSIVILVILAFISSFILCEDHIVLFVLIVMLSIIAVIYLSMITKRSKNGALEYKKWMAFKKFLLDFGRLDEKQLPEIVLWSKYLVYATVLGVAESLQKTMKIKLKNIENNDLTISDIYFANYLINNSIYHTVSNSVSKAVSISNATIANSNYSSGSGFGGGFSSGGGGGSIGGGGRGF